jgi:hypothetical protein
MHARTHARRATDADSSSSRPRTRRPLIDAYVTRNAPRLTSHMWKTACVLRQHSWVNVHDLPPLSAVIDTAVQPKIE